VDETTVKRLLRCGFRRTGIIVGGGYVDKYFFPMFEYHMFYVLYQFVTNLLTLLVYAAHTGLFTLC
jgi:hypothetical protein